MVQKFEADDSVACIVFDFNGDGLDPNSVTGYGSDLFIDGVGDNGNLSSGYGDIKLTSTDMLTLLSYLDSAKNPIVVIS